MPRGSAAGRCRRSPLGSGRGREVAAAAPTWGCWAVTVAMPKSRSRSASASRSSGAAAIAVPLRRGRAEGRAPPPLPSGSAQPSAAPAALKWRPACPSHGSSVAVLAGGRAGPWPRWAAPAWPARPAAPSRGPAGRGEGLGGSVGPGGEHRAGPATE